MDEEPKYYVYRWMEVGDIEDWGGAKSKRMAGRCTRQNFVNKNKKPCSAKQTEQGSKPGG